MNHRLVLFILGLCRRALHRSRVTSQTTTEAETRGAPGRPLCSTSRQATANCQQERNRAPRCFGCQNWRETTSSSQAASRSIRRPVSGMTGSRCSSHMVSPFCQSHKQRGLQRRPSSRQAEHTIYTIPVQIHHKGWGLHRPDPADTCRAVYPDRSRASWEPGP